MLLILWVACPLAQLVVGLYALLQGELHASLPVREQRALTKRILEGTRAPFIAKSPPVP